MPPFPATEDAAARIADRLGRGRTDLPRGELALIAEGQPPPLPSTWTDRAAGAVAAALVARARTDALSDGVTAITRYFDGVALIGPATLSPTAHWMLRAAAGEYCAALGAAQLAAAFGVEAQRYATSPAQHHRAHAIVAFGLALNGEYIDSAVQIAAAHEISIEQGWPATRADFLLLFAESLYTAAHMQFDRLTELADTFRSTDPPDPYWAYTAHGVDLMLHLLRREYTHALALGFELAHGSARHHSYRLIREFVAGIRSDAFIATRQYDAALALLADETPTVGHSVCFPAQRSRALLALSRNADVLRETDGCVTAVPDHCLRSLTHVLLYRGIAYARVGDPGRAARCIERALTLIAETGGTMTPFLMTPLDDVLTLITFTARARPHLADTVNRIRANLPTISAPLVEPGDPSSFVLSRAEQQIADLLVQGHTLADIARARSVSPNTVKSQTRAIYRKLGVATRSAAVQRLTDQDP